MKLRIVFVTPFYDEPNAEDLNLLTRMLRSLLPVANSKLFDVRVAIRTNYKGLAFPTDVLTLNCDILHMDNHPVPMYYESVSNKRITLANHVLAHYPDFDICWWLDSDDFLHFDDACNPSFLASQLRTFIDRGLPLGLVWGRDMSKKYDIELYTRRCNWLAKDLQTAILNGENVVSCGSSLVWNLPTVIASSSACSVFLNNTKLSDFLANGVAELLAIDGIEDVVWTYNVAKHFRIPQIDLNSILRVSPSTDRKSETSAVATKAYRTKLLRDFYRDNGYKGYKQIRYGGN